MRAILITNKIYYDLSITKKSYIYIIYIMLWTVNIFLKDQETSRKALKIYGRALKPSQKASAPFRRVIKPRASLVASKPPYPLLEASRMRLIYQNTLVTCSFK